jgi:serine/threonine-protein kinase
LTADSSVILGSVSYLSPEQVQRGIADARSDIYALGIVIFEMLTGKKPFDGESAIQIAYKHVNERIPPLSESNPAISSKFSDLIYKATSPNPDDRPINAEVLLSALRQIQIEMDPKRQQLSLELDLPLLKNKSAKKNKVAKTSTFAELKEKTVQLISTSSANLKKNEDSEGLKRRKVSRRVKRNRIIALLLVALLSFGVFKYLDNGKITVPSLVGLKKNEAIKVLADLGLKSEVIEEVFSEDIEKGKIIESRPGGGKKISPTDVVGFVISKGKERIFVPSLKGLTPDIASQKISELGFAVGEIIEVFYSDIKSGFVIGTDPKEKAELKRGSTVNLVVSKGVERIALVSYKGKGGEQALSELTELGFDVEVEYKFSDSVFQGQVISQDPDSSDAVAKGSKILLSVSKGPEFVFVPNVLGKSKNNATLDLENLGLRVITKGSGKVNNISPAIGSKVKQGSLITLTLR